METFNQFETMARKWGGCDLEQFGREFLPGSHPDYVREKFEMFRSNPFRYFGFLDPANQQRFVQWLGQASVENRTVRT